MRSKYWLLIAALITIAAMVLYFYMHPSYKLSLKAKVYYSIGDYDSALQAAKKAYEMNSYNRMAFTIVVQSRHAKKHLDFIQTAKTYYAKIKDISQQENVSKADKIRIKMLTQIVLDSYKRLQ